MSKVIVITGGGTGIGKEVARILASDHTVVIVSRDEGPLKAAAEEIGCSYKLGDVTDAKRVNTLIHEVIDEQGQIDVLVNNAGVWIQGELEDNDPDQIKEVVEVNTLGPIMCAQAVIPHMKKRGRGLIINTISQAGLYAKEERSVYNASKWAVTGLTKCLQHDLLPHGIRVTGLYPGPVQTDLFAHAGIDRDLSTALDPKEVAMCVKFVIDRPDTVCIPEMGIRPLSS